MRGKVKFVREASQEAVGEQKQQAEKQQACLSPPASAEP